MTESLSVTRNGGATGTGVALGGEEELRVVDLKTRRLVPRAPEVLARLDPEHFSAELHRSVVETNTPVAETLDDLRDGIVGRRRSALGGAPDRDEAVAVAQRVTPVLPVLLAVSASSPYWMGEDSGYASVRSLVWLRWPTAGDPGVLNSAAEHDELVADLIASGTITDPKMVYFDVRPSAHLPTVELRVTDSSPDADTVVLIAGLFRALVLRARQDYRAGRPLNPAWPPLQRAAMWRAARSGLEGELLDLPRSPAPVPAAVAVERLVGELRPQLEELGDWEHVVDLSVRQLSRGSAAARQRRALTRRGWISDVVDLVVADTRGGATGIGPQGQTVPAGLFPYKVAGDEAFPDGDVNPAYTG